MVIGRPNLLLELSMQNFEFSWKIWDFERFRAETSWNFKVFDLVCTDPPGVFRIWGCPTQKSMKVLSSSLQKSLGFLFYFSPCRTSWETPLGVLMSWGYLSNTTQQIWEFQRLRLGIFKIVSSSVQDFRNLHRFNFPMQKRSGEFQLWESTGS